MLCLVFTEWVFGFSYIEVLSTPHCPAQQTLCCLACVLPLGRTSLCLGVMSCLEKILFALGFWKHFTSHSGLLQSSKQKVEHLSYFSSPTGTQSSCDQDLYTTRDKNIISKGGQRKEECTHVGLNQTSNIWIWTPNGTTVVLYVASLSEKLQLPFFKISRLLWPGWLKLW